MRTHVLIVEDEGIIAEVMRDMVERAGHTVATVVDSSDKAIDAARFHKPGLILLDIRIKGELDGIETAFWIKESLDVPIVFITAHSDRTTVERAMAARPFAYLVKPVREAELVAAIQTSLVQHALEKSLRSGAEQIREILDHTDDLVIRVSVNGRVVAANLACLERLGMSPAQLCRLRLEDLIPHSDHDTLATAIEKASLGEKSRAFLTLLSQSGVEIPVEGVFGRRLLDDKFDGIWAVFHRAEAAESRPFEGIPMFESI